MEPWTYPCFFLLWHVPLPWPRSGHACPNPSCDHSGVYVQNRLGASTGRFVPFGSLRYVPDERTCFGEKIVLSCVPCHRAKQDLDFGRRLRRYESKDFAGLSVNLKMHLHLCVRNLDKFGKQRVKLRMEQEKIKQTASRLSQTLKARLDKLTGLRDKLTRLRQARR